MKGENPAADRKGISADMILVDGGSEVNEAARKLGLERAGCWAHLRRCLFDAHAQHEEAAIPLMAIRDVFLIARGRHRDARSVAGGPK